MAGEAGFVSRTSNLRPSSANSTSRSSSFITHSHQHILKSKMRDSPFTQGQSCSSPPFIATSNYTQPSLLLSSLLHTPPSPILLATTALLFIFILYHWVIYPAFLSPLARIPNAHWSVPFSRAWILKLRFERRENRTLWAVHRLLRGDGGAGVGKGYHGVVRTGPKELSVHGVEGVRCVYGGGWEKGGWYGVFDNYG